MWVIAHTNQVLAGRHRKPYRFTTSNTSRQLPIPEDTEIAARTKSATITSDLHAGITGPVVRDT